jgi:phosphopantothenoylcysteine decarboxylase/phosphopantothenate--cysteine ligase
MTKSAQQIVSSLLMHSMSGNAVHSDLFSTNSEKTMEHISLARWADLMVIAPASANFIAKLAYGLCDDLLSTMCLAKKKDVPIVVVPAMNVQMWEAQITQHNLALLKSRGVIVFEPNEGVQACGEYGYGRMLEPIDIFKQLIERFKASPGLLSGRRILITAGPTREYIDPVRYLTNASSGKMGYAVAEAAASAGANVTLVTGPTNLQVPANVQAVNVTTAQEMFDAVMLRAPHCDVFVSVAAVSDYCSKIRSEQKLKKTACKTLQLSLEKTPDILESVAKLPSRPIIVGFAAETENVIANAEKKLSAKGVDMIVANRVGDGVGFDQDENRLFILRKGNKSVLELPLAKKSILAKELISIIAQALR